MTNSDPERSPLLATLGVQIEPTLLELALTHRSFAYENGGIPTNERLEFLGDSILGQAVAVMLYRSNPLVNEGVLSKRRASLVSSAALADIARGISLGDHLRLGRGELLSGGRDNSSILADTVEALIGAVYLDSGADAATAFVLRLIAPLLADPNRFDGSMDFKTSLQELAARRGRSAPVYTVSETGPDHAKVFIAAVAIGPDLVGHGEGSSKKFAEMAAARSAVEQLTAAASR
jgi:ribonuclease-3